MIIFFVLCATMIGAKNAEFIDTAKKEMSSGHEWSYVGKKEPNGKVPALTIKPEMGNEYILFKLKRDF